MTALFARLAIFLTIVLGINVAMYSLLPEGWEQDTYVFKKEYFYKHHADSNDILLFGSSRIYRTFSPRIIDSVLSDKYDMDVRTFNLGTGGKMTHELYVQIEEFEWERCDETRMVLVELLADDMPAYENLFTARTNYPLKFWFAKEYFKWLWSEPASLRKRIANVYLISVSYIDRYFCIGYLPDLLAYKRKKDTEMEMTDRGCIPLDRDNISRNWRVMYARHMDLLNDTFAIARINDQTSEFHDNVNLSDLNEAMLQSYLQQIETFRERGIKLVYLLPLRRETHPQHINLYYRIPEDHRINLNILNNIPELKKSKYWFDRGHLEKSGSNVISPVLADSIAAKWPVDMN